VGSGRTPEAASEITTNFKLTEAGGRVLWQKLYESYVFERNLEKLNKLVFEAEDAIYLRSRELSHESHIVAEAQALGRAAKGLLEIKIKKLGWADRRHLDA